jgi:hypothetical protein
MKADPAAQQVSCVILNGVSKCIFVLDIWKFDVLGRGSAGQMGIAGSQARHRHDAFVNCIQEHIC